MNEYVAFTEAHVVEWFSQNDLVVDDFKTAFCDGVLALELVDKINPGSVNWTKVMKPKNGKQLSVFQRLANCTILCDIMQRLNPKYTGCGAKDFTDGNVKMMTGFFFSLRTLERRQRILGMR